MAMVKKKKILLDVNLNINRNLEKKEIIQNIQEEKKEDLNR
jgi:hypothetical protein